MYLLGTLVKLVTIEVVTAYYIFAYFLPFVSSSFYASYVGGLHGCNIVLAFIQLLLYGSPVARINSTSMWWTPQFSNHHSYELQCAPVLLTSHHGSEQQHMHYSRTFTFDIPSFVNRGHHKLKAPEFRAITHLDQSVNERNSTVSFSSTADNFPIATHVVCFLSVQTLNGLSCNRVKILCLYLIWRSYQGARHFDVDSKALNTQFRAPAIVYTMW